MKITMILATDSNGLIGDGDKLPWNLPADLKHFKKETTGKTIIMGRKTCDSLPFALPNRRNLVLTTNYEFEREGFEIVRRDDIQYFSEKYDEIMIIGGEMMYTLFSKVADKVILTTIEASFDGDTYYNTEYLYSDEWAITKEVAHHIKEGHPYPFTIMEFERKVCKHV